MFKGCFLEVCYLIMKNRKPNAFKDMLILPATTKMAKVIRRKEHKNVVTYLNACLCHKIIERCTRLIQMDRLEHQKEATQLGSFAMPLEEGTNVANMPQLTAFSQFYFNNEIHKELLISVNHQRKDAAKMMLSQQKIILLIKTVFCGNNCDV